MERVERFELSASTLARLRSAPELRPLKCWDAFGLASIAVDRMPNHPSGPLQSFNTTSTLPVGYQATLWLHFEIRFDCARQPFRLRAQL